MRECRSHAAMQHGETIVANLARWNDSLGGAAQVMLVMRECGNAGMSKACSNAEYRNGEGNPG